jgi:NAD(P)-dependent dehydrogenase (short-subunit alcohol dehydrogenase family)
MREVSSGPVRGRWTAADIPDQAGRTAIVTGANTGLGFETASALAGAGATVVLACRDVQKGGKAAARIREQAPRGSVSVQRLDLASLASVREAAADLLASHPRLDLLINNAGLMMPPYGRTADGFELQFGTNHLGHFALTGLLLDRLLAAPDARVVTVSSMAHRFGAIDFDDLQWERGYRLMAAYGRSKIANLMFTYELQRRLAQHGERAIAVAAHPGASATELSRHLLGPIQALSNVVEGVFVQGAAMGALPTLRAATDPCVRGGEYYGPSGMFEMRGFPKLVGSSSRSRDVAVQGRLWQESERLTGVAYPI